MAAEHSNAREVCRHLQWAQGMKPLATDAKDGSAMPFADQQGLSPSNAKACGSKTAALDKENRVLWQQISEFRRQPEVEDASGESAILRAENHAFEICETAIFRVAAQAKASAVEKDEIHLSPAVETSTSEMEVEVPGNKLQGSLRDRQAMAAELARLESLTSSDNPPLEANARKRIKRRQVHWSRRTKEEEARLLRMRSDVSDVSGARCERAKAQRSLQSAVVAKSRSRSKNGSRTARPKQPQLLNDSQSMEMRVHSLALPVVEAARDPASSRALPKKVTLEIKQSVSELQLQPSESVKEDQKTNLPSLPQVQANKQHLGYQLDAPDLPPASAAGVMARALQHAAGQVSVAKVNMRKAQSLPSLQLQHESSISGPRGASGSVHVPSSSNNLPRGKKAKPKPSSVSISNKKKGTPSHRGDTNAVLALRELSQKLRQSCGIKEDVATEEKASHAQANLLGAEFAMAVHRKHEESARHLSTQMETDAIETLPAQEHHESISSAPRRASRKLSVTAALIRSEEGSLPQASPRREARLAIFRRLADDNEIHKDHIPHALQLAGFPTPVGDRIKELLAAMTPYSTLTSSEFISFMEEYEEREYDFARKLFADYDEDNSQTLDMCEIRKIFVHLGFTPMAHVIHDIVQEVGPKVPEELSFDEFWAVLLHLRINEGFTRTEIKQFLELFNKFDANGNGLLESHELERILVYLGHNWESNTVKEILAEVDVDGNGSLDAHEFQVCMRKVREREVANVQRKFLEFDLDGSGGISAGELAHIVADLGYFPQRDEVNDALADIGMSPEQELDFDELWRFLEVYRGREGFSHAEMVEIEEVFNVVDADGSGSLSVEEMGQLFAMLGVSVTPTQVQRFVSNVDLDGSGTLDFHEFTKVVRQISQNACKKARAAFAAQNLEGAQPSILEVLKVLVPTAHSKDTEKLAGRLASLGESLEQSEHDLVSQIIKLRKKTAKQMKRNHGFGHAEVQQLRQHFEEYDVDKKGFLRDHEVEKLLEDTYPELTKSMTYRPQLLEIMKSAQKGQVNFRSFLKLVRRCRDLCDREKVKRERDAIAASGFTQAEVKEFRELFLGSTDRETISLSQLFEMVAPLVPLGQKNSIALVEIYRDVVEKDQEAEFAEFLLIFRRIIDLDTGDINECARVVAAGGSL
jgi:Ca2+-binding EF-hand superfamily protein